MGNALDGESAIKAAGETYLPMPSGFRTQSDEGSAAYSAYQKRAQFPELVAPSLSAMVGIIHAKEAQIEMPGQMAGIIEAATSDGVSLEDFHRRVTRDLLLFGRYGILADAPANGGDPFLAGYSAASLINWDQDFFVLDECGFERDGFAWGKVDQYRVLTLENGRYVQSVYRDGQVADVTPTMRGGAALSGVPFVVANAVDVSARIVTPPLIGIARSALAIYQLSADYRLQLFMSGQETMVAINGDAPTYVGAGVTHEMHGTDSLQPDLKYVSPTCAGISAHKEAMQECREEAAQAGARLHTKETAVQESGEAKRLRHRSETATLMSVAQSSCALLERSLRNVAMMQGLNEEEVVVTPPSDLLDSTMSPQDAAALLGVYNGGGMSWQTLYENLQRGNIASAERDHEAEFALIENGGFALDPGATP